MTGDSHQHSTALREKSEVGLGQSLGLPTMVCRVVSPSGFLPLRE